MAVKETKSLFTQIKESASLIGSALTIGTIIVVGTRFVDASTAGNATAGETKKEFTEFQKSISTKLDSIQEIVTQTQSQAIKTDKKVDVITRQFNTHMSKDKSITKEDLIQIIQEQNVKKNSEINPWDEYEPSIQIRKIPKK